MHNDKVVIATVPFVDEDSPLAAPAVLKASLQRHGIECVALDLNIEIYNKLKYHLKKNLFLDFFYRQKVHEEIVDELISMLDFYVQELLWHQPTIIGLSLFSKQSQVFCAWLCAMLRLQAPECTIVIGGPGLETLENNLFKYPDRLRRLGLIDDYITGDAESSFVAYVRGSKDYPGINNTNWQPNLNFDQLPIPDYSEYRWLRYGNALLPIIDSRGCVQQCEFCDVIAFWKKFQYLNADNIFSQMLEHIRNYGIRNFQFSSSICNGNLREFKKLVRLISDYNDGLAQEQQITWIGSFIIRPAASHPESLWQLIKKSNGYLLTGVESLIEHVRIGLGKKFSNKDLEHHLEMGRKYQVHMNLLLIAAYHTETSEEWKESKQWFIDHKDFANNPVMQVQLTLPAILAGTKLETTIEKTEFLHGAAARLQHGKDLNDIIKSCGFITRIFFH
jgi:radical SAM superfamily enzyme YgiQ (UPF0313 family)